MNKGPKQRQKIKKRLRATTFAINNFNFKSSYPISHINEEITSVSFMDI